MKLTVDAEKLKKAHAILSRAVPRSLHNAYLLEAEADTMSLRGVGDGAYAEYVVDCVVEKSGKVALGMESLGVLNAYRGPVGIGLSDTGRTVLLEGTRQDTLKTFHVDFAIFDMPERSGEWYPLSGRVRDILYTDGDKERVHNVVWIAPGYMAATNTHRFAFLEHDIPVAEPLAVRVDDMKRGQGDGETEIAMDNRIWLKSGTLTFVVDNIQAPNFHEYFQACLYGERQIQSTSRVERSELRLQLEAVKLLATADYNRFAMSHLATRDNCLQLSTPGNELGGGYVDLDADGDEAIETDCSAVYLIEALSNTEDDHPTLSFELLVKDAIQTPVVRIRDGEVTHMILRGAR